MTSLSNTWPGGEVATEGGGEAPREVREHPLLRVVGVGGLAGSLAAHSPIPATSLSRKRARASSVSARVRCSPSSRSAAEASSSTAYGTEPAYSSSSPSVNRARPCARGGLDPSSTRATSDLVRSASPASMASRGSRRQPVSGQCRVVHEQRSPLHRGRCGGVPLPSAALIRCAHQVLRELLVWAGGGFGSVPDPGERVWIGWRERPPMRDVLTVVRVEVA